VCGAWPRCEHSANERDELAALHSITRQRGREVSRAL
jgi:hypothetical protein